MPARIANPTLRINNEAKAIVANSFKFTEGDGETTVETQMVGKTPELVTSDSGEDKKSIFSFEMMNTASNIDYIRGIKKNPGNNVVDAAEAGFARVFQQASITNDPEKELSATGKISVEMCSLPAI